MKIKRIKNNHDQNAFSVLSKEQKQKKLSLFLSYIEWIAIQSPEFKSSNFGIALSDDTSHLCSISPLLQKPCLQPSRNHQYFAVPQKNLGFGTPPRPFPAKVKAQVQVQQRFNLLVPHLRGRSPSLMTLMPK